MKRHPRRRSERNTYASAITWPLPCQYEAVGFFCRYLLDHYAAGAEVVQSGGISRGWSRATAGTCCRHRVFGQRIGAATAAK